MHVILLHGQPLPLIASEALITSEERRRLRTTQSFTATRNNQVQSVRSNWKPRSLLFHARLSGLNSDKQRGANRAPKVLRRSVQLAISFDCGPRTELCRETGTKSQNMRRREGCALFVGRRYRSKKPPHYLRSSPHTFTDSSPLQRLERNVPHTLLSSPIIGRLPGSCDVCLVASIRNKLIESPERFGLNNSPLLY